MLHMPSPMLLGGASEDLYPVFLAKITALATNGSVSWSGGPSGYLNGKFRVTPAAAAGTMYSSTWNSFSVQGSNYDRMIQHALPSQAAFNGLASLGHQVYFQLSSGVITYDGFGPYGASRNGYQSLTFVGDYDVNYPISQIIDLIRFEASTGKAWRSNPSIGSAESEYDFRT